MKIICNERIYHIPSKQFGLCVGYNSTGIFKYREIIFYTDPFQIENGPTRPELRYSRSVFVEEKDLIYAEPYTAKNRLAIELKYG